MVTLSRRNVLSTALSVMCVVLTGCKSGGGSGATDSSNKAVSSLKSTRGELVKAKGEVHQANAALDKLAGGGNVQQSYKAYTKEVADIKAAGDRARARANDMNARGREYVANWEREIAQISSAELKAGAEARRAKVQENYDQIKAAATSTGDAYRPYLLGLQEIQKVLANDLTPGGIESAKTAIVKTKADGDTLVQRLDALIAQLDSVSSNATPTAGGEAVPK